MSRTQAQNTADAASHAAYVAYRATGDERVGAAAADFILQENKIGNDYGHIDSLQFGEWDFDANTFQPGGSVNSAKAVVSRRKGNGNELDLFFAPILGFQSFDVLASGVAAGRTREIVLISDISGSFAEEIDQARAANIAFLDYMNENPLPGDRLAHVVFSGTANYPDLHELASPVRDYNSLLTEFGKLTICKSMPDEERGARFRVPAGNLRGVEPETGCHTSQARGLHRALQELTENGNEDEFQAMLLLTDGIANTSLEERKNDQLNDNPGDRLNAEHDAEDLVELMWYGGRYNYVVYECDLYSGRCGMENYRGQFGGGVHLWTVYFGSDQSNVDWLEYLVSIGAGNRGEAKNTANADELEAIYLEIAASIPVVLTD